MENYYVGFRVTAEPSSLNPKSDSSIPDLEISQPGLGMRLLGEIHNLAEVLPWQIGELQDLEDWGSGFESNSVQYQW